MKLGLWCSILACLLPATWTGLKFSPVGAQLVHNGPADVDSYQQLESLDGGLDKPWQRDRKRFPPRHHVNRKQLNEYGDSALDGDIEVANKWSRRLEAANRPQVRHLSRFKRAATGSGRGKSARVQLAQRPQKSTTTTSTTTTTTTEPPPGPESVEELGASEREPEASAEEDNSSGDYEEIQDEPNRRPKGVEPRGRASGSAGSDADAAKVETSEAAELEAGEGEQEEDSSPTTTTSTTLAPTTPRRVVSSGKSSRKVTDRPRSGGATATSRESVGPTSSPSSGSRTATKQKLSTTKQVKQTTDASVGSSGDADDGDQDDDAAGAASGAGDSRDDSPAPININATQKVQPKKKALLSVPFIRPKNASVCTREAFLEFPRDLIGDKWRSRGLVVVHIAVVCYMFYSLALVCERYFMPSLEEFAQRLNLTEDVAGATLMSAGSSAPELFTAVLGVFVAKGDVGTGTIVGSAVFNILCVIGICAFVSTTSAQLQWWPVLRDSVYYAFSVLVLIIFIYDERITSLESFTMIALYGVYILIMVHNETLKELVTRGLLANSVTAKLLSSATLVTVDGPDDVFGSSSSGMTHLPGGGIKGGSLNQVFAGQPGYQSTGPSSGTVSTSLVAKTTNVEDDSMYLAALLMIVKHKRLFRSTVRFQSAARYVIVKRQHRSQRFQRQQQQPGQKTSPNVKPSDEVNYFGPDSEPLRGAKGGGGGSSQRSRMEAYAQSASLSKQKFSIVSKDDYEFWNRPPEDGENYYLWMAKIPVNYVLHHTIPDCSLYPDKYLLTFIVSILWTALFSYVMVWMVTLIGYTLGIPDSIMGATFLAAGTSVPDCYSSVHAARNGMADMAVSNSIGSNVFDILIGLSLPWFIQTTIYPQVVATINSRGVIYSVILLFLSLIVTIYLLNKYEWTLKPRLGLALLIAYGLFIILTWMLEFNLFGHVNPPSCPIDT